MSDVYKFITYQATAKCKGAGFIHVYTCTCQSQFKVHVHEHVQYITSVHGEYTITLCTCVRIIVYMQYAVYMQYNELCPIWNFVAMST